MTEAEVHFQIDSGAATMYQGPTEKNYKCSRGHVFRAAYPETVTFSLEEENEVFCLRCVRDLARKYLGVVKETE